MGKDKKTIFADVVVLIGFLLLTIGLLMFTIINDGVFFSTAGMGVIFMLIILQLPIWYVIISKKKPEATKTNKWIGVVSLLAGIATLIACVLESIVIDYIQPITLSTMVSIFLIAGSVCLLFGALLELLFKKYNFSIAISSVLLLVMFTGMIWVNAEGYKDFNNEVITSKLRLFTNGEGGYTTFRIPSIITLDHEVINEKKGGELTDDVLLATAEGRKNSSHDRGAIDLVGKISLDSGKTWSELITILSYKNEVGKYGNSTPVFDRNTADLVFPYMTGTEKNEYNYSTYVAVFEVNKDGSINFNEPKGSVDIGFEKTGTESGGTDGVRSYTLMVGPGKTIQLTKGEHKGRIVVPSSGNGNSFVMYCDGNPLVKENWKKSEPAGTGNECEVVELSNGELCMVTREMGGCTGNHFEQYQRLAYSNDGGCTWYKQAEDTSLKSPICMSSIDKLTDGTLLLSYPNSFLTRVNLTIGVSKDNSKTFSTTYLYKGPAGYSCTAVDSNDNIFVLAEIGKVNYNEELMLFKVDKNKLLND